MLRRAFASLFSALALTAPAFSQDVFVPRELKAQAVHPTKEHKPEAKPEKPKEVVKRAEAVTENDAKPKARETAAAKTEKTATKDNYATAKTPAPDDLVTIKVEKTTAANPTKEKKEKAAPPKEKADVEIPTIKIEKVAAAKEPAAHKPIAKAEAAKSEPAKEKTDKPAKNEKAVAQSDKAPAKEKTVVKEDGAKVETITAKSEKPAVKDHPATVAASKSLRTDDNAAKEEQKVSKKETAKPEVVVAKTEKTAPVKEKEKAATKPQPTKSEAFIAKNEPAPPAEGPVKTKSEIVSVPSQKDPPPIIGASSSLDMGFTKLADGFDFPVGRPEGEGYYKARGFRSGGHVGEDWDGVRGGDTDLGDPIYCIGNGVVVFARDVHRGWGNVVIVRHAFREGGSIKHVDSLYGHLNSILVRRGQRVTRGQRIGTMGTAHGQYDAHLHLEIRKNLEIGMSRAKFAKSFSNYYDPSQFIESHRHLPSSGASFRVAMNTFIHDC